MSLSEHRRRAFSLAAWEFYTRYLGPDRACPANVTLDEVENLYLRYLLDDSFAAWFHRYERIRAEVEAGRRAIERAFYGMLFPGEVNDGR